MTDAMFPAVVLRAVPQLFVLLACLLWAGPACSADPHAGHVPQTGQDVALGYSCPDAFLGVPVALAA